MSVKTKDFLDRLYTVKVSNEIRLKSLKEVNVFPGDDNNSAYNMHLREIEYTEQLIDFVNSVIEQYLNL